MPMNLSRIMEPLRRLARRRREVGPRPLARNGAPRPVTTQRPEFNVTSTWEPQALARLGSLELISQTVVDGFVSGKHRSTHKGGCTEFAGYRAYTPGDDLRMLDWKLYAKSDRYYVKRFDDETNLQALIVVDASGSMRFGRSTVSKWDYARMVAACLSRMLVRQRDLVGLAIAGDNVRDYVRPLSRLSHLVRVMTALAAAEPTGESMVAEALTSLIGRMTRRGMMILISDCFGDVALLQKALQQFRVRGHDVLVLQILAPEELSFPFTRSSEFLDLESTGRLHIQPTHVRRNYLERFGAFQHELATAVTRCGCDYEVLTTDRDLGDALTCYLRRRAATTVVSRPPAGGTATSTRHVPRSPACPS